MISSSSANSINPAAECGPRILLFSGGSALHTLCRLLKAYTHNSIHLLTPFDSGGSSATLRRAFAMPAVGDLRQRLMALANESALGSSAICQLCDYRLPYSGSDGRRRQELATMISGDHVLTREIPHVHGGVIARLLNRVLNQLPNGFDLRGASVGNLILVGGYFDSDNDLLGAINLFSKLVDARGIVRPIVSDAAHLIAELENGRVLSGQHKLTGKEAPPIESPVRRVLLSRHAERYEPAGVVLDEGNGALIDSAELICFAPGSFYSSLIANLLPEGVGRAIAANSGPKVFIPNLGIDPEQHGMSVEQSVSVLLRYLLHDAGNVDPVEVLNYVVIDTQHGIYPSRVNRAALRELGIELIDLPLVTPNSSPYYDNVKLLEALLSLTSRHYPSMLNEE